jgi:hypothetical protein
MEQVWVRFPYETLFGWRISTPTIKGEFMDNLPEFELPIIEVLPNMRNVPNYIDILKHLVECHGEEGKKIANDPDQSPFMWHEFAHVDTEIGAGTWNHEHEGTNVESANDMLSMIMSMMSTLINNPDGIEQFKAMLDSEEYQEESRLMEEYRKDNQ